MRYLLDTDVIIDYLRGYAPTVNKLRGFVQTRDDLAVLTKNLKYFRPIREIKTKQL